MLAAAIVIMPRDLKRFSRGSVMLPRVTLEKIEYSGENARNSFSKINIENKPRDFHTVPDVKGWNTLARAAIYISSRLTLSRKLGAQLCVFVQGPRPIQFR